MGEEVRRTDKGELTRDERGVIRFSYQAGVSITLADAQAETPLVAELADGKRRPILVDLRPVKSVDGEARAYYSGPEASANITAAAMLVGSAVSRVIGNFFIGLNKPPFPVKLFSSEDQALAWLEEHQA